MKIREAKKEDIRAIGILTNESNEYLRGLGSTTNPPKSDTAWLLRDGFGDNPAFHGLVAEEDNKIVGYLLYHSGYDTDLPMRLMRVIDLYVSTSYRRQGIGRSLIEKVSEICLQQGGKCLVWEVWLRNRTAIKFYEQIGANRDKEMEIMVLPLTKDAIELD